MSRIVDRVLEYERAHSLGLRHFQQNPPLMAPVYNPNLYVNDQIMDDIARWGVDHLPGSTDPWSLVREAEEPLHQLLEELLDEVFPRKRHAEYSDIVARYGIGAARGHIRGLLRVSFG